MRLGEVKVEYAVEQCPRVVLSAANCQALAPPPLTPHTPRRILPYTYVSVCYASSVHGKQPTAQFRRDVRVHAWGQVQLLCGLVHGHRTLYKLYCVEWQLAARGSDQHAAIQTQTHIAVQTHMA